MSEKIALKIPCRLSWLWLQRAIQRRMNQCTLRHTLHLATTEKWALANSSPLDNRAWWVTNPPYECKTQLMTRTRYCEALNLLTRIFLKGLHSVWVSEMYDEHLGQNL